MPTTQEILELVVKVQGEAEGKRLEALIARNEQRSAELRAEVDRLNQVYERGSVQTAKYAAEMLKVEKAIDANAKSTQQLLDKYQKTAIEKGDGRGSLSGGLLEFSRAAEDAQYGIRGVLNNIPGLVQQLGGGAGLAGALSLVAVSATVLYPKLEAIFNLLAGESPRVAIDQMKSLQATIDELSKKPLLLRVEQVQLENARRQLEMLQRGMAEWNALQESFTSKQAESGALVAETLRESAEGAEELTRRLTEMAEAEKVATSATIAEAVAARQVAQAEVERARTAALFARDAGAQQEAARRLAKAKQDIAAATLREQDAMGKATVAARAETGEMIRLAKAGDAEAQRRLREGLARAGAGATAAELAGVTPEALAQADEDLRQAEKFGERAAAAGEKRRARQAKEAREQQDRVNDANKAAQEWEQGPAGKMAKEKMRREGKVDQFGNIEGDEGFDVGGARAIARKASREGGGGPGKGPTAAQVQEARVKAQQQGMAEDIFAMAQGIFNPQQATEAAAEAQKTIAQMGILGQTQEGVNFAIAQAMQAQFQSMQALVNRMQMQAFAFQNMAGGFQQVAQPLQQNMQGALNFGGFP